MSELQSRGGRDRDPAPLAPEVLLTVKEFAGYVRQHPNSVYRSIRHQTFHWFPIERNGRSVFVRVPSSFLRRIRPSEHL